MTPCRVYFCVSFQIGYALKNHISKASISLIIPEVCDKIWSVLGPKYIQCPTTPEAWLEKVKRFSERWNYPRALAAIDGKHCQVQAFGNSGSTFRNFKSSFSIVLLALADADYKFIYCDVGYAGASNDSGIWNASELHQALVEGRLSLPSVPEGDDLPVQYHLIGDDAFGMNDRMMKPYPQTGLSNSMRMFNYRFSRARRVVESTFGIMANRFRILRVPILQNYDNARKTVQACTVLHNMLMEREGSSYGDVTAKEMGLMPALEHQDGVHNTETARAQRDTLAEFFMTNGAVDFQWHQCFKTN